LVFLEFSRRRKEKSPKYLLWVFKLHKVQINFFEWFEAYAQYHQLYFSFSKSVNVSKIWKTSSGEEVISQLPPTQRFSTSYANTSVVANPFKLKNENEAITGKDIKSIFEQNNYTNKYLQSLGEYLVTKPTSASTSSKPTDTSTSSIPLFKPYEISRTFATELRIHQAKDYPQFSDLQCRILEIKKTLIAQDTPSKEF